MIYKFKDVNFEFSETSEEILEILKSLNSSIMCKAAGIESLSSKTDTKTTAPLHFITPHFIKSY